MSQPGDEIEREADAGMPRWVKVFVAIAIVLIVVFAAFHLTGQMPMGHGG